MHIQHGESGTRVDGMARLVGPWVSEDDLPTEIPEIVVKFVNEGAALVLETQGGRVEIEVNESSQKICDLLFEMFPS